MPSPQPTRIIDSHTGGEPTRIIVSGGPDLGSGPLDERRNLLRTQHDRWRRALCNEPRGSEVIVGALLTEPVSPDAVAGVIFFNNVGYLGMCGHGTIGLVATLAYMGRLAAGEHALDTPVGPIAATLFEDGRVCVANVPSYRLAQHVAVEVNGRLVHGDIAWGGNWFFLCADHGLSLTVAHVDTLNTFCWALRRALAAAGLHGAHGAEIDHIELTGPAQSAANSGRNFVHCPGGEYDRSPCGTGTSAKLACLAADGKLAPGALWRQESVIDSVFEARYTQGANGEILPHITGRAHVMLDSQLIISPDDPFAWGLA